MVRTDEEIFGRTIRGPDKASACIQDAPNNQKREVKLGPITTREELK